GQVLQGPAAGAAGDGPQARLAGPIPKFAHPTAPSSPGGGAVSREFPPQNALFHLCRNRRYGTNATVRICLFCFGRNGDWGVPMQPRTHWGVPGLAIAYLAIILAACDPSVVSQQPVPFGGGGGGGGATGPSGSLDSSFGGGTGVASKSSATGGTND